MKGKEIGLMALLVAVFALSRWPGLMPPSFSAAYAFAFCAGVYFPPRWRWIVPLGAALLVDILLNTFHYNVSPIDVYVLVKIGAFAGLIALGRLFRPDHSWLTLTGGGVLGALLFYLVTNTVSWLYDPHYAKTLAGWVQALTFGRPEFPPTWQFFRNTLLSGGLFAGLFAGAMKISAALEKAEEPVEEPVEEPKPAPDEARA